MIEAYSIGVSLTLNSKPMLGPLAEIIEALTRAQKAAANTQISINEMAASLRGAGRVAASFADAMERAAAASQRMRTPGPAGAAPGGGFGGGGAIMLPPTMAPGRLSAPMPVPLLPGPGGAGGGGAGAGGGIPLGNPRGGPFPVYDSYMAGAGLMYAGQGASGLLESIFGAGADAGALIAKMRASRFTEDQVKAAIATSRKLLSSVPGFGYSEGLDLILQTAAFTGDPGEALDLAPNMAFNAQVLSQFGKRDAIAQIEAAARAGELTGLSGKDGKIDYKKFEDFINKITAVVVAGGGTLDIGKYLTGLRQFGVGAQAASTDFLTAVLPAYMKMMGEQKAGTALASLQQVLLSPDPRTRSSKYLAEQKRIGLRDENGNLINQELLQSDVFGYTTGFLLPQLVSHGINTPGAISKELYRLFSRQTVDRLMSEGIFNAAVIEKEADRNRAQIKAGKGPLAAMLDENPLNAVKAYHESVRLLLATLADPNMGAATLALKDISGAIKSMADTAKEHPGIARLVFDLAAAVAALGVAAGGALLAIAPLVALGRVLGWAGLGWVGLGWAGAGAVGAAATNPAAVTAGRTLLGRLGLPLAAGAVASALDGDDAIGRWVDRHVHGAGAVDDWFYRHTGGWVGRPSVANDATISLRGDVNLDGRKVGNYVAGSNAKNMSGPRVGPATSDHRSDPYSVWP